MGSGRGGGERCFASEDCQPKNWERRTWRAKWRNTLTFREHDIPDVFDRKRLSRQVE